MTSDICERMSWLNSCSVSDAADLRLCASTRGSDPRLVSRIAPARLSWAYNQERSVIADGEAKLQKAGRVALPPVTGTRQQTDSAAAPPPRGSRREWRDRRSWRAILNSSPVGDLDHSSPRRILPEGAFFGQTIHHHPPA